MPPKTNEAEKKPSEANCEEPDEMEKELMEHELVLGYMKSKLGKYQESEERLFVENLKLKKEIKEQTTDFKDINAYLNLQLNKKTSRLQELEKENANLEKRLKQTSHDSEFALSKLRRENENLRSDLEKKTNEFNKKIRGTQEFLTQKEELEEELLALKKTMEETTRKQERQIADMERDHIQDRESWKRETAKKVKEAKAQMMQLTDNQLEITTKRTIMENEQMASELAYQSRQTENMLHHNEVLIDDNGDLKRQIELSKQTQDEFAKRNLVYQRTIHRLLCQIREEKEKRTREDNSGNSLKRQLQRETIKSERLKLKLEEREETIGRLNNRCMELEEKITILMHENDENARFLLRCMDDIKHKTVTVVSEQTKRQNKDEPIVIPGRLADLSESQRERALEYLLKLIGVDGDHRHRLGAVGRKTITGKQRHQANTMESTLPRLQRQSNTTRFAQTIRPRDNDDV